MTTAKSPLHLLKTQADKAARMLKDAEQGEFPAVPFSQKLKDARSKETVIFAVAMDDKIIKIEIPWTQIRDADEAALSAYILKHMQESPR